MRPRGDVQFLAQRENCDQSSLDRALLMAENDCTFFPPGGSDFDELKIPPEITVQGS